MCEALGSEPVDEDIPVEFADLPEEVQQSLEVYGYLPDRWDGMSGTFLGKDYSIVFDLFNMFDIVDNDIRQLLLRFMSNADSIRATIIHQKQKAKEHKPSS